MLFQGILCIIVKYIQLPITIFIKLHLNIIAYNAEKVKCNENASYYYKNREPPRLHRIFNSFLYLYQIFTASIRQVISVLLVPFSFTFFCFFSRFFGKKPQKAKTGRYHLPSYFFGFFRTHVRLLSVLCIMHNFNKKISTPQSCRQNALYDFYPAF